MDIRVENENWNHLGKNVCQEFQVQRIAPARLQCHETAQHFYCTVNSGLFGQGVGGRRRIIAGAKMEKAKEKREAYVAVTNTPKPHEFKTVKISLFPPQHGDSSQLGALLFIFLSLHHLNAKHCDREKKKKPGRSCIGNSPKVKGISYAGLATARTWTHLTSKKQGSET